MNCVLPISSVARAVLVEARNACMLFLRRLSRCAGPERGDFSAVPGRPRISDRLLGFSPRGCMCMSSHLQRKNRGWVRILLEEAPTASHRALHVLIPFLISGCASASSFPCSRSAPVVPTFWLAGAPSMPIPKSPSITWGRMISRRKASSCSSRRARSVAPG